MRVLPRVVNHRLARQLAASMARVALVALAIASCKVPNESYDPSRLACSMDGDCSNAATVCDTATDGVCVQCTQARPDACVGITPVCGATRTCHACASHDDCASKACLPDGSCGSDNNVAYLTQGKTATTCNLDTPCGKVSDALATGRPYVKFTGTIDDAVTLDNRDVTFLAAPNAALASSKNGVVLEVKGTSRLQIYDLELNGGSGAMSYGISVALGTTASIKLVRAKLIRYSAGAIVALGGSVSVFRSTIANNPGGGISIMNASFNLIGNVFFNNGDIGTTVGGVAVSTTENAANRMEFNSFSQNEVQNGSGAAIQCTAGIFTAKNNIMFGNGTSNQTGGACAHACSITSPGTVPPGGTNSSNDPRFLAGTTGNLHLAADSPARGKADPASDLSGEAGLDIDGEKRTTPADLGADEVP
jgi:hypothetical protein